MRILRVHNRYQQRGGEDTVFEAECGMLEDNGNSIRRLEFSNDDIPANIGPFAAMKLAVNTIWSQEAQHRIVAVIDEFQPDVVHFDNTFPLVSPAAYSSVRKKGVAVVQTLHNYRLLCPSGILYHNGAIYEESLGHWFPWKALRDAVYRDSMGQTAVVAAMLGFHKLRRTYQRDVDRYIALTEFARDKFAAEVLPADKVAVKPNFVRYEPSEVYERGNRFLFVGRISPEKGIDTLLRAHSLLPIELYVAGDGPLSQKVSEHSKINPALYPLGRLDIAAVRSEMSKARALVFPSEWYEGMPMTILEAFSCGTPVIASRLGAMREIVTEGETGILFEPGNAADLAEKLQWAGKHPVEMQQMGDRARKDYEAKYTAARNYELLMDVYDQAIANLRQTNARSR